ncbi:hypothetical protein A1507_17715 [Methylomonas koyamae]|uniref:Uncharacterized protein n=1 Tax=Methylomonas koyamae TaxID=702114 RepID=A0A177N5S8_9GAMM|nr:hypothetical protein [Methylomonas koyamae]OAI13205.1 hypothetical protein A1507_17715 [Methylomonas koyamae]
MHTLPPEKLDAIRLIGRHVLQAKNKGQDEPSEKEQLVQLRTALDKLIAAEALPSQTVGISLENKAPAAAGQQVGSDAVRTTARTQAWDVVTKLRQDASQWHNQTKAAEKHELYAAGFPVGQQRGRLFDEWADKLETTLSDANTDRLTQLRDFRERLKFEKHGVIDLPLASKTPTIQAMPWEEAEAPKPSAKQSHKNKSRH